MTALTDDLLGRLLDETASSYDVPEHGPEQILAAIAEPPPRLPVLRRRWVQLSAAAAVLAFVAGLGVVSLGSDPSQQTAGAAGSPQSSDLSRDRAGYDVDTGGGSVEAAPVPAPVVGSVPGGVSAGATGGAAGSGAMTSSGGAGAAAPVTAGVPAPVADAGQAPAVGAPTADEGAARVVKSGELSLVVKDKQVSATLAAVERAAKAQGGYLASGTADESGDNPSGELTIRVPVARFEDLVAAVRGLDVKVLTASTSGKDVTAAYSDLEAQLRTLRAARERFLLLLSKAKTIGEILTVQQRVDDVSGRIDRIEGQRKLLASQSDLSTLTVFVSEAGDPVTRVSERRSGLSQALRDAKDGFTSGVEGAHPPQRSSSAPAARPRRRCRRAPGGLAGGAAPAPVEAAPLGSGRVGRRIGVMGGTFDPVHHGHLSAANEVADRFGLDEVVFVPTGQPWQKADTVVSPAEDRYLMTVIATASNPLFSVSRTDIDRAGATYTYDTLVALREQYGADSELFFITGADALAQILGWVKADELFALAHFVGVSRPGYEPVDVTAFPEGSVTLVDIPALAISSSDCRARVGAGQPVWYLVPDGVVRYIAKRGLYR